MKRFLNFGLLAGIAAVIVVFTGCATSAPRATFVQPLNPSAIIRSNDQVIITVQAAPGVSMIGYEKERLTQRIQESLDRVKATSPALGNQKSCAVEVTVTTYDKGSAFARAMLAGLGQIHIDAQVNVFLLPAHEKISDFTIHKTFAWGGVYGASTSIEDAELGFADGVANALIGQEEAPKEASRH
jgi:hypothetical protein